MKYLINEAALNLDQCNIFLINRIDWRKPWLLLLCYSECKTRFGIVRISRHIGTHEILNHFDMFMSYGWGSTGETWRQNVPRRDVRLSHDVTSDRHTTWRQTVTRRKRFVKWLLNAITHNAHPAARLSQYDNSHPVPLRCFWILLEFHNTIVRVRSRVIRDMIFGL